MGRMVSQQSLSEILGVNRKTLTFWQREGMPIAIETENGLANQYDTETVITWWLAREIAKVKGESEKDRLARLQGDKLEIELAVMRGALLPSDQVEPAWTGMVVAARQTFLAMSSRMSQLVAPMTDPDAIRITIDEEVEVALQKMSTYDEPSADGAGADGVRPMGSAAADQAVAVG